MRALKRRGAKMIVFHGSGDGVFSSDDTAAWYDSLRAAHGDAGAAGFARLFVVPAMNHCRGGPATDQFDLLTPLVQWVEQGVPPDRVTAQARGAGNAVPQPGSARGLGDRPHAAVVPVPESGALSRHWQHRACREFRVPLKKPAKEGEQMKTEDLIAIDMHTHLEVSCRNPFDNYGEEFDRAADKYFRSSKRPTMDETLAYYREKKIGFVNFTVDAESQQGRRRIPNEEIADAALANPDIMIAFGSVDPHKGKFGAREVRRLIEQHGVKGFKFHPTVQGFLPADRMAWPLYEVINEYKLPAVFHSGHSGIGSGMRCGGGLRLQNSNPMLLEDVAIAFPDMQIIIAHPSWPWQDEALSLAMHKPNIWIDLSGWSPKYFPPQLVQYANTLLSDRILFGSDFPLIQPDRWLADFEEAGFKDKVKPGILKGNAMRLLGLGQSGGGVMPASLQACRLNLGPLRLFQGAKTGAIAAPTSLGARHWHMRWSPSLRPGLVGSSAFRTETSSAAPES